MPAPSTTTPWMTRPGDVRSSCSSDLHNRLEHMDFMTTEELAAHLRVEPKTLANWRYLGRGPIYVKDGGLVRYRREDVDAWERDHTVHPTA